MRYNNVSIEALSVVTPKTAVLTKDIEHAISGLYGRLGLRPGWLESVTGIEARRFWPRETQPSDVAAMAAERALADARLARSDIDAIISTSVCKDYIEPAVAAIVHGKLGLPAGCTNYDVGNACLGFLTGMSLAADQIELGRSKRVLVVAGESSRLPTEATIARLQEPTAGMAEFRDNLATLTLGSAGVAMILSQSAISQSEHRFCGGIARAATQWSHLCVGTATKMTTNPTRLLQEGVKLAKETWSAVHSVVELSPNRVAQYALHQVGAANHDAVISALGIPTDRAPRLFTQHGNVGACGVPMTLFHALQQGHLTEGDRAAMMGIGSGLNVMMFGVDW